MIRRRKTRIVAIGNVKIGSPHPIAIQSMTKTSTCDVGATVGQIKRLEKAGCEIVRVAVKTITDAKAISSIKRKINIPLVADIHFRHALAIEAIKQGADKIRINPGNIQKSEEIDRIIDAASGKGIPIRIGVNSGSLKASRARVSKDTAGSMVDETLEYIEHFKRRNFNDLIISLKASDVITTITAYRAIAEKCDYPLHLGVTAAGLAEEGVVRSSIGIGTLLAEGVGDTIRVSLTDDPLKEVTAAKRILNALGLRRERYKIIACPTCGRCQVDLVFITKRLEKKLEGFTFHASRFTKEPSTVAIMGCEVNGPGEVKGADYGIAFGKNKGAIFRDGKIVKTVKATAAVRELIKVMKE